MAEIAQEEDEDEECIEDVAGSRTEGSQGEEQIAEDAAAEKGQQIHEAFPRGNLPEDFIYCGNSQDQK